MPAPRLTTPTDLRGDAWLVAAGVLGVLMMVTALGTLLVRLADAVVPRTQIEALEDRDFVPTRPQPGEAASSSPTPAPLTGVRNVLVVGLDSREGLTEEQLLQLGTEDTGSRLTDTIIWVQYDAEDDQVRMVTFPRDLAVTPDGAPRVKLNALHSLGGPELLVRTLEEMVGEDLDHYVEVSLAGFIELADALDGVEVCLEERMYDVKAGVNLPAGCQELTATQAAGFVRAREVQDQFGAGTAGRAARQQYFIRQAVSEAVSSETLTSPSRIRSLISMARGSVVVDEGFSTSELLRFANAFRSFDADRITGATAPFTTSRLDDGLFYDQLTDDADELFTALRLGRDLPEELVAADEPAPEDPGAGS